jgi:triosephosphate isomerase
MTTVEEARANAERARRELEATLDALEDKLNVPKRVVIAYRRNPLLVIGVGIGVAAATIGAIAWAVARRR